MTIQPLSHVNSKATIAMMQDDTMASQPKIAVAIAECIGQWAEIENILGLILSMLLGAEARAGIAMFHSLNNTNSQMSVLNAAAEIKLTQEFKDVFDAVMILVRGLAKERNRFVHWCWARSKELPEALLLVDPEWKTNLTASVGVEYTTEGLKLDHVFVVKLSDVLDVLKRMIAVRDYAGRITGTIWNVNPAGKRVEYLQKLSNEPPVREVLDRLIERRKNNQEIQG
jgi:hypothetical protein